MNTPVLSLIRGINVGGNSVIKMADLKIALKTSGFTFVKTYIQSGNIITLSNHSSPLAVTRAMEACLAHSFGITTDVVSFTKEEWETLLKLAPDWWGQDKDWRHYIFVALNKDDLPELLQTLQVRKPEIEKIAAGLQVVFQSILLEKYGQTSSSKLVSSPIYKRITARNYTTATKLAALMEATAQELR